MDSEVVSQDSESKSVTDKQQRNVRIVGIGASAGGLEVLRELMESLPHSNALSYIIAQHVSPTHVSMLMNLLAPLTRLTVQDLVDKQLPEPGIVYITPPNSDVVLEKGRLRLTKPKQPIGPKPSVNHFFHSLADELEEQAIGIILSGTGSDGASGMRAIKAGGGITIVQEPDTAKYDGMPKAAILTGSVDLILSPNEIGAALARLLDQPRDLSIALGGDSESDEYTQISNLVRSNTAFKLSEYKQGTVRRRIARRMNILGIGALSEYIEHLKAYKDESLLLMRDAFISVTAFFRDQEAFFALERVIGEIVRNQKDKGVIRCWVPGCASGEEVYSIAMLFEEAMRGEKNTGLQYMIFASDLDDDAVERARAALYPTSELETIPKALRDLYTEVVGDYCQILKSIRSRVVFERQNVIDNPPFARLDLVSCRNLMIYLTPLVQKRVMEVFHYALNPGGYLFLGKSEGANMHRDLFKAVDSRARIYQRQQGVCHYALPVTQGVPRAQPGSVEYRKNATTSTDLISMRTLEELTERYAPPTLLEEGKKIEGVVETTERESLIISELEQELANTRTHLNIVVEELETSNEELQSANEELLTVNEELQVKTAELESTASDLINVKQSLAFPLIVVDRQLRITQVNDACSAIAALDNPLESCSLNSVQWLVEVPGLSGHVRRVIQDGKQYRGVCIEGEKVYQLHIMPYRLVRGELSGAVLLFDDITDRKAVEDELRLAASVFSNTQDGILITTTEGIILKANNAFGRMLGYSTEDIIGQHTRILHSGRHDADFYRAMWKEIAANGIWQGEIWDRHKDGHMVPVWLTISSLYDNDGKVIRYIAIMYDISKQKESQEHINYLAHYDPLTGLPNRFLFTDRLGHALAQAKRQQRKLALLFIDLDNFKQINDSRGHPVGDELLSMVAKRLTNVTRESDTVARLSGDEFTLLIEDSADEASLRMTAQKILKILSEPFDLADGQAFITASIGIAICPDDGDSIDSLLKHADLAMYRSKEVGRNHFNFYAQEMSDRVHERMTLNTSLRQALDQKGLELHYQPIMNVGMGTCIGAEALIRWQHSDMGWISPTKFIPVAEESDLIHLLGEWVLRTACLQMNGWLDAGLELGSLAVNVSGKQIVIGDFVNITRRVLEETGCPPERIVLELTESFIMRESEGAIKALNQLRALGFGIAIDDFGTGYSSLSYLKRLPVTKLKLDQSFVQDIPGDSNDAAIARAILGLGDILGLEVVAEGVESKEQHKFLLSEGCAQSQGFLYSRPLTSPIFADFVPNRDCRFEN